ncbi:unnamed protein product [Haemonchus placei]|uniref:Uncharacterized protein n=1 Tax=Haemonchus placei TaxID=6290 RepID=A0A3P7X947_HAEPC|nr:unnamed protein product [Haemonchus placei]
MICCSASENFRFSCVVDQYRQGKTPGNFLSSRYLDFRISMMMGTGPFSCRAIT